MKRIICLLAAAVLLAGGCGASVAEIAPEGRIRCIVMGWDHFRTMEDTSPCSANNVEIMTAVFRDFLPGAEITRKFGGTARAEDFAKLIAETCRGATEADVLYLYLSTHGVIWEENGETRMAFLISDGKEEDALEPRRIREILDGIPGRKILILDACHSGAVAEEITGENYRVIASGGRMEDSYFWIAPNRPEAGTGYFTSALEGALRASLPEQIDPDGDGWVTAEELRGRMEEIYGASTLSCSGAGFGPEETEGAAKAVFRMTQAAQTETRITGIRFDQTEQEENRTAVSFRFTVRRETRVDYRLIPMKNGKWAFDDAMTLPDRERSGGVRGQLSPGEKTRRIRVSEENLGEEGKALLQIISLQGLHGQVPVLEASKIIVRGEEN